LENTLEKYKQRSDANGAFMRDKIIVVTHYLPTQDLLHPKYKRGHFNFGKSAYVSNLDDMIYNYNFLIRFWLCGHSHMSRFTRIGNTLLTNCGVIGNPWEDGDSPIFQDTFEL
jgi:Icc-related predicted phosphoesterase